MADPRVEGQLVGSTNKTHKTLSYAAFACLYLEITVFLKSVRSQQRLGRPCVLLVA